MNEKQTGGTPQGMSVIDIWFVLFRHKWKILIISALGVVATALVPYQMPTLFESQAKLLVKYVVEAKSAAQIGAGPGVNNVDEGEVAINTEIEILSSLDLAKMAAEGLKMKNPEQFEMLVSGSSEKPTFEQMGEKAKKLFGIGTSAHQAKVSTSNTVQNAAQPNQSQPTNTATGSTLAVQKAAQTNKSPLADTATLSTPAVQKAAQTNQHDIRVQQAAGIIQNGLFLDVPKRGKVIVVGFRHPNKEVVQPVLDEVIQAYSKKHSETHRQADALDWDLRMQLDGLKAQLGNTEEELRRAKTNVGVVSLEESKKLYYEQMARIRQSISDAEADLAQRKATMNQFGAILNIQPMSENNVANPTNQVTVPSQTLAEYRRLSIAQDSLKNREQELLYQYTTNNSQVKAVQEQMNVNEKLKKRLEDQYPVLLTMKAMEPKTADPNTSLRTEMLAETARITGFESKIAKLKEQLETVSRDARAVEAVDNKITQLERTKKLDEENYMRLAAGYDQVKLDKALNSGKLYNLTTIQEPSPWFPVASKIRKTMAMVLFGSIAGAIGLAFFIELYLDQTLKRPIEVETKIGVPLFVSIPKLGRNGKVRRKVPLLAAKTETPKVEPAPDQAAVEDVPDVPLGPHEMAPWHPRHQLRPFFEALRERLITFFEVKNYTHKPKLVAITSCAEGAGVSTIAAGLAASLSETGDGNVLLVDMNQQNGAAHQFYKGDLACGLDDALELERRSNAMVQDNLYVVSENSKKERLSNVLPQRFKNLVPRLKTSDYDYIIFDLPPVSQISMTPRMARFMDAVLIVVESEKTDREVVKRASALLAESKTNVGIVLNKGCDHLPKRLRQEL